ncbi:hypothetical protein BGZ94_001091 [Podila epigama]|nr:hypothetical protein BGZ94_001091 [Podila epigama]
MILSAHSLSAQLAESLLLWIVDTTFTDFAQEKEGMKGGDSKAFSRSLALRATWKSTLGTSSDCRYATWTCLPRVLTKIITRYSWAKCRSESGYIDTPIHEFVNHIIEDSQDKDYALKALSEHMTAFDLWKRHMEHQRAGPKDIFTPRAESTPSCTLRERVQARLRQDASRISKRPPKSITAHSQATADAINSHQKAFIQISEAVQTMQEYPGCPPRDMLIISHIPAFTSSTRQDLRANCSWVESTIQSKSAGWQSCVKLKVQFYAVFEESSICKDARAPLFGSWSFWKLDINALLTSTLNQLTASEGSSSIPPQTLEALTKLSLIAPYQVLSRIVLAATLNKGQSHLFLQLLANLGQLVWLRADKEQPTLLLLVIADFINSRQYDSRETAMGGFSWTQPHQDNFSKLVEGAMVTRSRSGNPLLDPVEFISYCVIPLLQQMVKSNGLERSGSACFGAVAKTVLVMYGQDSLAIGGGRQSMLAHDAHFDLLLLLLRLQTLECPWSLDRLCQESGIKTRVVPRRGGKDFETVSNMCEIIVSRLTLAVEATWSKLNDEQKLRVEKFLHDVQNDDAIEVESEFCVVPLALVCRQHLAIAIDIPRLPGEISILCERPLARFEYLEPIPSDRAHISLVSGLISVLYLGRMCDPIFQDITQGLSSVSSAAISNKHAVKALLVAVLYRCLSVSTRSQSHRLMLKGMPAIMDMLGGMTLDDMDMFTDMEDSPQELVQSQPDIYWQEYNRGLWDHGHRTLSTILMVSQVLVQLSLEPLTLKNRDLLPQVYGYGLGFDIEVDQLASVIQSATKSLSIDWPSAPLDLVLFSFMSGCRMCFRVMQWCQRSENSAVSRRTSPDALPDWETIRQHVDLQTDGTSSVALEPEDSDLDMEFGKDTGDREQRETTVLAKAHQEFVLMAMYFSEEIVRRQDAYYQVDMPTEKGSEQEKSLSRMGSARGSRRAERGRGASMGRGHVQDVSTGAVGASRNSSPTVTYGDMDKATQSWLNILKTHTSKHEDSGPKTSTTTSEDASTKVDESKATNIDESHGSDEKVNPRKKKSVELPKMLSAVQQDILELSLNYLPPQEQRAVRARLHRLLASNDTE